MRESLLHKVLAPIWIFIFLGLLLQHLNRINALFETILFDCFCDLLHNVHKSLAKKSIILNQAHAILIFLNNLIITRSLIFLYWMSSD